MILRSLLPALALGLLAACGSSTTTPDAGPSVTWYRDVLPIVQANCLGCHATGQIAPNALDTYAAAKPQAALMAADVKSRRMPVWKPDPACGGPFVGQRILTQEQIDTIDAWATQGAPEGNPAEGLGAFDAGSLGLPRVDATIAMTEPYTPSASLSDDYRCFVIDPGLTASKFVTGYDIQPGVRPEVHHVILYAVDRTKALAKDAAEAGPGWTCFGGANINNAMPIGAWAPGMPAVTYPSGTGIELKANQVLAMQVHYNMDAHVRAPDVTSAKLMYATGSVTAAYLVPLVDDGFSIPPGVTNYTPPNHPMAFPNTYGFPIKVYGFLPHLHQLGQRITVKGPNDQCLVDIPQWDFHWQQQYFRRQPPVELKDGEALTLSCTWNNSTSRTVTWGEGTSDEMCLTFIYATP